MIYLGFGHPLPIWLAVIGVVDIVALPFLITAYIREALGPHDSDGGLTCTTPAPTRPAATE